MYHYYRLISEKIMSLEIFNLIISTLTLDTLHLQNEQGFCLDGGTMKLMKCDPKDINQKWTFSNYNAEGLNYTDLHY